MGSNNQRCDFWLWDGSCEYIGSLVRLTDGSFSAHVRQAPHAGGLRLGRRLPLPFVELQRRFVGRRFMAYFKHCPDTTFHVEIENVQRSTAVEFDHFIRGHFCEDEPRRKLPQEEATRGASDPTTQIWL